MNTLSDLGPACLSTDELCTLLGADTVSTVEVGVVDYDLPALTTGSRWYVDVHTGTGVIRTVVKIARSVTRSPLFAGMPADQLQLAEAGLPWRIEPDVYRSSLADDLPGDMRLPYCHGVRELDGASAAIWLERIPASDGRWTDHDYTSAARALGRLAGSPRVAAIADEIGHPMGPVYARQYWERRLAEEFGRVYLAGHIWDHPVMARHVGPKLRHRVLEHVRTMGDLIEAVEDLPLLTAHGDACPNNLLRTHSASATDPTPLTVIDWAFFGRNRLGFDLTQLVLGEIGLGRETVDRLPDLERLTLSAYREGLADSGVVVDIDELMRTHRLLRAASNGVAALPLSEIADADPADPGVDDLMSERVRLLELLLDGIGS